MGKKLTDSDIAVITAPALTDWRMGVDVSSTSDDASGDTVRMLAAYEGYQFTGTSFPVANLWDGMKFHRTDLGTVGMTFFYDETNTQWLSDQVFTYNWEYAGLSATFSSYTRLSNLGLSIYIIGDVEFTIQMTTNDASNYFSVVISAAEQDWFPLDTIMSFDTSADGTGILVKNAAPTTRTPTESEGVALVFTETGTAEITRSALAFAYRLIAT